MTEKYNEILRLKDMLESAKIPFDFSELYGGYHIIYSANGDKRICSVIEHDFSYGREKDLLEIKGLLTELEEETLEDDVLGYLTAEEVFQRIKKHWEVVGGRRMSDLEVNNNLEDVIGHPNHYCKGRKFEPKDVIKDWNLNFNLGNTVKYISRNGRKEGNSALQDLKKARQYLDFEIEYLEKEDFLSARKAEEIGG